MSVDIQLKAQNYINASNFQRQSAAPGKQRMKNEIDRIPHEVLKSYIPDTNVI